MLAQVLIELAEDHEPVYQRLERLRSRDDSIALSAAFTQHLRRWETDDRWVRYQGVAAFGQELDVWVAQVQREVLPRFPLEAMRLFAAFLELDKGCSSGSMTMAAISAARLNLHVGCGRPPQSLPACPRPILLTVPLPCCLRTTTAHAQRSKEALSVE